MFLNDIALLASNTSRTKAYLQAMIRNDYLPSVIVLYGDDKDISESESTPKFSKEISNEDFGLYFNDNLNLGVLIQMTKAKVITIKEKDVNSELMKTTLISLEQKYIIYSGYGGQILKPHLFEIGKQFLHVHAGILPQYRGSTTVYYSIIQDRMIGATAFFLGEGIDLGDIIVQEKFDMPDKNMDIDYIYEPWVRSQVLIKALQVYIDKGAFESKAQDKHGETYFIIHPVLKHIALSRLKAKE